MGAFWERLEGSGGVRGALGMFWERVVGSVWRCLGKFRSVLEILDTFWKRLNAF